MDTIALKPTDRRFAAIKGLVSSHLDADLQQVVGTRDEISAEIIALATLGRTSRWTGTVDGWAAMVRDEANDLRWALVQGSIFAGYAA